MQHVGDNCVSWRRKESCLTRGDCLMSSRRKTTSHDKKMFFKTWHKKQVLFILNAFSSLVNVVYEERVGGGKLVFLLGPRAWSQEVWALFLAPL